MIQLLLIVMILLLVFIYVIKYYTVVFTIQPSTKDYKIDFSLEPKSIFKLMDKFEKAIKMKPERSKELPRFKPYKEPLFNTMFFGYVVAKQEEGENK